MLTDVINTGKEIQVDRNGGESRVCWVTETMSVAFEIVKINIMHHFPPKWAKATIPQGGSSTASRRSCGQRCCSLLGRRLAPSTTPQGARSLAQS